MKTKIFLINEKISDIMHKFDMSDGGTKVFGDFLEFEIVVKKNVLFPPIDLFRDVSKLKDIGYFILEGFIYIKDNYFDKKILSFSDGKKFLFRSVLEEKYKQVDLNKVSKDEEIDQLKKTLKEIQLKLEELKK